MIFLEAKRGSGARNSLLPAMMLTMNRLVSVCVKVQDERSIPSLSRCLIIRKHFLGCSKRSKKTFLEEQPGPGDTLEKELGHRIHQREASSAGLKVRISGLDGNHWPAYSTVVKNQPHQNYWDLFVKKAPISSLTYRVGEQSRPSAPASKDGDITNKICFLSRSPGDSALLGLRSTDLVQWFWSFL